MRKLLGLILVPLLSLAGCASGAAPVRPAAKPAAPEPLRSFGERDAVAIIDGLLREAHLQPVAGWTVVLPQHKRFEVDVRLGDSDFGIEWVSADARARDGYLLPQPDPTGQLRLLTGAAETSQRALILLLDHATYRFTETQTLAAAPSESGVEEYDLHDAEQRLRRDLTDFVEYARSQYRL